MIDFNFIYKLEGWLKTRAYIPKTKIGSSHSGITVGAGFDLGQYPKQYISALPISDGLKKRLLPYVGLTGDQARYYLNANPLQLTEEEVGELMGEIEKTFTAYLSHRYSSASPIAFDAIPNAAQTVIASVAWQYGDVDHKCPKFWAACTKQEWSNVIDILHNFGDVYKTRRNMEAEYLQGALN